VASFAFERSRGFSGLGDASNVAFAAVLAVDAVFPLAGGKT
jgi:hypothetical protein